PAAAQRKLRFALADLLVAPHPIELLAADERTHFRSPVKRWPDRDGARLRHHRFDEAVVNRSLHQNPAAGGAHLALVEEHAEQRAFDGGLEIGIGEEDVRRLPAKL